MISYGIDSEVGFIEVGKLVDFVLWKFVFFGIKFSLILKLGFIVVVFMGDFNVFIFIL